MEVRWERRGKEQTEGTKLKYTHSRNTQRNPLMIDLEINNERQEYKIGTVGGRTKEIKLEGEGE
jgi:hypothetical protein